MELIGTAFGRCRFATLPKTVKLLSETINSWSPFCLIWTAVLPEGEGFFEVQLRQILLESIRPAIARNLAYSDILNL